VKLQLYCTVNASVTRISVILFWISMYAIRKISFSLFHEHSWGKVRGRRRRKYVHYTKYKKENVIFCWPCISVRFLPMTNLTHFFNVFIYFTSLHVSNSMVFNIKRSNVLIHHLVCIGLCGWLLGKPVIEILNSKFINYWFILSKVKAGILIYC